MSVRNWNSNVQFNAPLLARNVEQVCTVHTVRGFYLNVGLLQVVGPSGEQVLSHLLLKVAGVGDERRREQTVSSYGGHLVLEGLAGLLPAVPFSRQTLQ